MRNSPASLVLGSILAAAVSLLWAGAASADHDTRDHERRAGHADAPPHGAFHRGVRVVVNPDGYGYVSMGRDCRVFFDARGQQTSHQGHCSGREVRVAHASYAANLRDHHVRHHDDFRFRPRVFRGQDGYGYVEVGRGCRVFFDARGQQTSHQGHCSARQAWIAAETWGARRHAFRW